MRRLLPRGSRARLAVAVLAVSGAALGSVLAFAWPGGASAEAGVCSGELERDYACYESHLASVLEARGGRAALAELLRLSKTDDYALAKCHPLSHSVGRAAVAFYGSVSAAAPHGDGTCWSGYYHGAMEQYLLGFDDSELASVLPTICEPTPGDPYSFDYYNCVHGLGHGVAWHEENDVFRALPYCDSLDGGWERSSCYSGVFMQNIVVDGTMHHSVNLRPDDPVYPCNAVERRYKNACYLGQTSYILRTIDYDYAEGFRICERVDEGFVATCYRSMGRDISANSHRDPTRVVELCSLGRGDLQNQCFAGAAKNAVYNDRGVANADALCSAVPLRHRDDCTRARNEAASTL